VTLMLIPGSPTYILGKSDGTYEQFTKYIDGISLFNVPTFDVIFVDGRARVAAAWKALPYLGPNSTLFIHDWDRKEYHPILQWYVLEQTAGRMARLHKKPQNDTLNKY